jgi:hypothetical protein
MDVGVLAMKKPMGQPKNPFIGYTVAEVFYAENTTYAIQVGTDFYVHNGKITFNRKAAVAHYNKILNNLIHIVNSGTAKQRKTAMFCLSTLQVVPFRLS